ncbi:MAG: SIMPL domain-containing protein [bacterium]|nr:SIMPL domain-containing protein [bacterium]
MDSTNEFTSNKAFRTVGIIFLILASLFLLAKTLNAFRGEPLSSPDARPQITVSGQGEFSAVPDIAMISYSVIEEGKTPKEAQDKATKKWNDTLAYLKDTAKIADKDVKTIGYNLTPKYDYSQTNRACPTGFCAPGTPVLVGYIVTQTAEVKIRDLAKAGDTLAGIGGLGVQNVNGLDFTFDDPDKNMAEARKNAIAEAKAKAEVLASDLGVRLVRISRFEENGNSPIYYSRETMNQAKGGVAMDAAAPVLPTGENKLISNVTITYEIR